MAIREHLKMLSDARKWYEWRRLNPTIRPDLSGAQLSGESFQGWDFSGVNLDEADMSNSAFIDANFTAASLAYANLSFSFLDRANFTGAFLGFTNFSDAHLPFANFTSARMSGTAFLNNDLSRTIGLDTVSHFGTSSIGIDTIVRSRGRIPEPFLKGAGVPDEFLRFVLSLNPDAATFHSCFISYSTRDQDFAERLHADLQNIGVRCWYAPEDLKIGDRIRPSLDQAIRNYDRLLIVLSEASVQSQWVEQEIETALQREREEQRTVLFPIRLDDAVMAFKGGWPAVVRNTRHIGDFTKWKEFDNYRASFLRLVRDLRTAGIQEAADQLPQTET